MKKCLRFILLIIGLIAINNSFAQINTGGTPALKFGKNTAYKNGIMPSASTLPIGGTYGSSQAAADAYNTWVTNYVRTSGGVSRVLFDDGSSTVSEGIGYGMLLSVYAADKTLFDGLWAYYKAHLDGNGLMHWKLDANGNVTGSNSATDADLDVAMALIIASEQWSTTAGNTYSADAKAILQKIKNLDLGTDGSTLNGDQWGNTNSCRNPSYFAPGYYTQFAKFDAANSAFWGTTAITATNSVLKANMNTTSGLISNWCDVSGTENSCGNTGSGASGYGADACRNPWRMAVDYLWNGASTSSAATTINGKLVSFVNGYENQLKGPITNRAVSNPSSGSYINGSYATFALAPMTSSAAQGSLNKCYTAVASLSGSDAYFNATMRCLSLFVMTGNFWAPGASGFVFPPTIANAVTNSTGTQIILTANKALTTSTPATSAFTVYYNGTAQVAATITSVAVSGSTITLTIATAPQPGQTISLSYNGTSITSTDNAVLAAFTQTEVLNMLAGNETILDDFDDGNELNNVGGFWFSFNDTPDQLKACTPGAMKSTITPLSTVANPFKMTAPGYNSTAYALNATYTLGSNYTPYPAGKTSGACATWTNPSYVGIGTYVNADQTKTMDWTNGTGVTFWYKGPACSFQVIITEVSDFAFHAKAIPACTVWTQQTVLWTQLAQPTWASPKIAWSAVHVSKLQWQFGTDVSAITGNIWIDDVHILGMPPVALTALAIGVNPKSKITNPLTLTKTSTDTLKLIVTPTPITATYPVVFWYSSDTTVVKIDYQGNVKVIGYGTATITARSKMSQNIVAPPYTVTVPAPKVYPTSITLSPTTATVNVGQTALLIPTFAPTGVTETGITWTSAIPTIATVASDGTVTGVSAGTVVITAVSTPSVTIKATATITVVSACTTPTIAITPTATSICNGASTLLTASGTTGVSYLWSNAATTAAVTISPTATTAYIVTATVAGGCKATASSVVTVNSLPTVSISPTSASICSGSGTTLTASGTGTSYSWSNLGSTSAISVSPTINTTYTVTASANGCSAIASSAITVNAVPTVSISPLTASVCSGTSATLTANGAAKYNWSTTETTAAITVSPTTTTVYTVTGTGTVCTATATTSVTVNTKPTIILTPSSVSICAGTQATITAIGATSYAWNTLGTGSAINVSPTVTTTYLVTGTSSGCSATASQVIAVNTVPTLIISANSNSICAGVIATLTASGASSYVWDNNAKTASISVSPATTTIYNVTGIATGGCSSSMKTTVTVNAVPTLIITPALSTICTGSSANISVSGATSYNWSNGLGTSSSVSVSPSVNTSYSVTGTNVGGCISTATTSVAISSSLSVTIAPSKVNLCAGNNTLLTASGASSYTWSNNFIGTSQTVSPTNSTTYSITGIDAQGCSGIGSVAVTVNSLPTIITMPVQGTICSGSSTLLTVSGALSYTWSNNKTSTNQTVSPTSSTVYSVTGIDINGCSSTSSTAITVNSVPTVSLVATLAKVCAGNATTITASGANSYSWSNNETASSITVTPSNNTTYSVTGSSNGCSAVASKIISVNQITTATITKTACDSIVINNQTIKTSGTVSQKLTSVSGCDSLLTINVIINKSSSKTVSQSTCNSSLTINGQTYQTSGTYTQSLKTVAGCDSNLTLNLTFNKPTSNDLTQIAAGSYTFNTKTYNTSGDYVDTLKNSVGCDSILTLHLTITAGNIDTTVTACSSFTINGSTFTNSGDYTVGTNITLHLTIKAPSKSTVNRIGCDSVIENGITYKQSGTFYQTIPNKIGCDSVITLNVSINKSVINALPQQTGCDSVVFNSTKYFNSTILTQKLKTLSGCDSIVTCSIVVKKSSKNAITVVSNGDYVNNGTTYTTSGTFIQHLTNKDNCDSVLTIALTIVDITALTAEIKTANDTISGASIGTNPGQHPVSAQTTLQAAIDAAKAIATNKASTQNDVNSAVTTLTNAISLFKNTVNGSINKSALIQLITSATNSTTSAVVGIKPGNYSQTSVDVLKASIINAQIVVDNVNSTQSTVDVAVITLQNAINSFTGSVVPQPNKTKLDQAITTAISASNAAVAGDKPGNYPSSAIATIKQAISDAQAVFTSTTKTQTEVDNAVTTLNAALATFQASVFGQPDKSVLISTIQTATTTGSSATIGTQPGQYRQTALDSLTAAITKAQTINASTTASVSDVSAAVTELQTAINTFSNSIIASPGINKTALSTAITSANGLISSSTVGEHPGNYSPTSISILTNAINAALSVKTDVNATQLQVDNATSTLNNAISTFKNSVIGQPSKTALNQSITTASNLSSSAVVGTIPGNYPSSAVVSLNQAITSVQSVVNSSTASQSEVDAANSSLQSAISTFKAAVVPQPDKSALNALINDANSACSTAFIGSSPGNYTGNAKDSLSQAISKAQNVFNATTATSADVNAAVTALQKALTTFNASKIGQPDKNALNKLIASATSTTNSAISGDKPGNYPTSAILTLNQAITTATAVANSLTASQLDVDNSNTILSSAITTFNSTMVGQPDKTLLNSTITNALSIVSKAIPGTQQGQYPQSAIDAFNVAITNAQTINNSTSSSANDVSTANTNLEKAITVFQNSVIKTINSDFTLLDAALNLANSLSLNSVSGIQPGNYPSSAILTLQTANDLAQAVRNKTNVIQSEVDLATAKLDTAIATFKNSVIGQPDKTTLNTLIQNASTVAKSSVSGSVPGNYPKTAIDELNAAIVVAQNVKASTTVSQQSVDTATTILDKAIKNFNLKVIPKSDITNLNTAIADAKSLLNASVEGSLPTQYPTTAMNALKNAITSAILFDKVTLAQADIDAATSLLLNAVSNFKGSINPIVDKKTLSYKIDSANSILGNITGTGLRPTEYSQAVYDAFNKAIIDANIVFNNVLATNSEVSVAISKLDNAISTFKASVNPPADKTKLVLAIEKADSLISNVTVNVDYPEVGVNNLISAIKVANKVKMNIKAYQSEVDVQTAILDSIRLSLQSTKITKTRNVTISTTFGPNPVEDVLHIKSSQMINTISIVSLKGEIVKMVAVENTNAAIDFSAITSGNYIVIVYFTDGTSSVRMITK